MVSNDFMFHLSDWPRCSMPVHARDHGWDRALRDCWGYGDLSRAPFVLFIADFKQLPLLPFNIQPVPMNPIVYVNPSNNGPTSLKLLS